MEGRCRRAPCIVVDVSSSRRVPRPGEGRSPPRWRARRRCARRERRLHLAWHAPGAAPDAACRLRALRTAGDGNCLLRRRARAGVTTADAAAASAPRPPRPRPPRHRHRAQPCGARHAADPTDGHLGVGGDALGTGALLGPLRRRVAASRPTPAAAHRSSARRGEAALAAVAPKRSPARSVTRRAPTSRAPLPTPEPGTYLEKVHVYALALALRRPLVVYADLREHGSIAGVYLPDLYALLPAAQPTRRVPLALAYIRRRPGHFSSCCGAEGRRALVPPLTPRRVRPRSPPLTQPSPPGPSPLPISISSGVLACSPTGARSRSSRRPPTRRRCCRRPSSSAAASSSDAWRSDACAVNCEVCDVGRVVFIEINFLCSWSLMRKMRAPKTRTSRRSRRRATRSTRCGYRRRRQTRRRRRRRR